MERFSSEAVETAQVPFDIEISELLQGLEEPWMPITSVPTKDGISTTGALTILESTMLNSVLRAWTKDLGHNDIRKDTVRGLAPPDRSLKQFYAIAEGTRRTKLGLDKLAPRNEKAERWTSAKTLPPRVHVTQEQHPRSFSGHDPRPSSSPTQALQREAEAHHSMKHPTTFAEAPTINIPHVILRGQDGCFIVIVLGGFYGPESSFLGGSAALHPYSTLEQAGGRSSSCGTMCLQS